MQPNILTGYYAKKDYAGLVREVKNHEIEKKERLNI
jgi:hypothetical protein